MMGQSAKVFAKWFSLTQPSNEGSSPNHDKILHKDYIRRAYEQLWIEFNTLQRDHKQLKQVVEGLRQDYELSKDYDPLRRYNLLKGMIKRTVLHVKFKGDVPGNSSADGSSIYTCKEFSYSSEITKKLEEIEGMSTAELKREYDNVKNQLSGLKGRHQLMRESIQQLDEKYEHSKHFSPLKRYHVMKRLVQNVLQDQFI